ncbi:MAG: restriction endonuclease subunit S [Mycobacterium sp.]
MSSWPIVRLGDLAADEESAIAIGPFGSRMKADNYIPSGVRVIRGQNFTDTGGLTGEYVFVSEEFASTLGASRLLEGDIVLPHRGAIGRAALVPPGAYVMSTSLMRILDRACACPEYVNAFLCSNAGRQEILKFASTVGTPGIGQPLASLRRVKLPLPPIEEQERIAGVLGALDGLIEANRSVSERASALAAAIASTATASPRPGIA